MFLDLRDGILHPEKVDPDALLDVATRRAVQDATGQKIYEYFGGLVDERQAAARPRTSSRGSSRPRSEATSCRKEDILDILFLFLIAGLDTVSDSLTCFYAFLATHPEHRRQIVDDPSIIPAAVEELLRWESPVPGGVPRVANEDTVSRTGTRCRRAPPCWSATALPTWTRWHSTDPFEVRFDRAVQPPHRLRGRRSPLPRKPPGPARAAHHPSRMASANSGVPDQGGPREARVPAGPSPRQGPDPHLEVGAHPGR